jgi:hypothetical protein
MEIHIRRDDGKGSEVLTAARRLVKRELLNAMTPRRSFLSQTKSFRRKPESVGV